MDEALRVRARMPGSRGEDSLARGISVPAMRPRPRLRAGRPGRGARRAGRRLRGRADPGRQAGRSAEDKCPKI